MSHPIERLRHHGTGAVERGESSPIVEIRPTRCFVVSEIVEGDLVLLQIHASADVADAVFDRVAGEGRMQEHTELDCEVAGTRRLTGDDAHSVQIIEKDLIG